MLMPLMPCSSFGITVGAGRGGIGGRVCGGLTPVLERSTAKRCDVEILATVVTLPFGGTVVVLMGAPACSRVDGRRQ